MYNFFNELNSGKLRPRCVYIDSDNEAIEEIICSDFRRMYDPQLFHFGKENCGDLFAIGRFQRGIEMIDECMDLVRKQAEQCNSLQCMMIYNALGGGTGSGVGSLLYERLAEDFPAQTRLAVNIYPSTLTTTSVEPYNVVHSLDPIREHTHASIIIDNATMKKRLESRESFNEIN